MLAARAVSRILPRWISVFQSLTYIRNTAFRCGRSQTSAGRVSFTTLSKRFRATGAYSRSCVLQTSGTGSPDLDPLSPKKETGNSSRTEEKNNGEVRRTNESGRDLTVQLTTAMYVRGRVWILDARRAKGISWKTRNGPQRTKTSNRETKSRRFIWSLNGDFVVQRVRQRSYLGGESRARGNEGKREESSRTSTATSNDRSQAADAVNGLLPITAL